MKLLSFITLTLISATSLGATTYKVDPSASVITWKGEKKLGSYHTGTVKIKEGSLETDKKNTVTGLQTTVDMSTISNADLAKDPDSQKKLVRHLSSDDFFKIDQFPVSTFKLTKISIVNGKTIAIGDLTMLGKTNSVEFPVITKVEGATATFEGKVKVDRTKWGLRYGSGNFFKELTADKIIKDEFELDVKIIANK